MDFLTQLRFKDNRIREIVSIEKPGKGLRIVLASGNDKSDRECLFFGEIFEFHATLFGAPGDTGNLSQNLIGLDYWHRAGEFGKYNWELNSDECTWNWIGTLPEMEEC